MLQSTSLLRGKTDDVLIYCLLIFASIHFPLAREDQLWTSRALSCSCFNPLPSCEGRRSAYQISRQPSALQSTSLLRGKTGHSSRRVDSNVASIHFPLAREDSSGYIRFPILFCFNPLPSCEGRLLLTPQSPFPCCFNPLPSCEGRLRVVRDFSAFFVLQSTSLLRGKTSISASSGGNVSCFNPLPSCEGRLYGGAGGPCGVNASIHFPLAREDSPSRPFPRKTSCFNPLPSCEGRRLLWPARLSLLRFNPLPSCEGRHISIKKRTLKVRFNPLPSCEGRPCRRVL